MIRLYLLVVILLAFVLAGCGGKSPSDGTTYNPSTKYTGAKVDSWNFPGSDGYYLDNFTMPNGHKLVCVEYDVNISCNWGAFNKEVSNG
jgi:PBP1b-binding outer membrane lipoprotein LpoB